MWMCEICDTYNDDSTRKCHVCDGMCSDAVWKERTKRLRETRSVRMCEKFVLPAINWLTKGYRVSLAVLAVVVVVCMVNKFISGNWEDEMVLLTSLVEKTAENYESLQENRVAAVGEKVALNMLEMLEENVNEVRMRNQSALASLTGMWRETWKQGISSGMEKMLLENGKAVMEPAGDKFVGLWEKFGMLSEKVLQKIEVIGESVKLINEKIMDAVG